ncbi:MAG: YHS domain-containing protein, partial [Gaiellaceae bacterium]
DEESLARVRSPAELDLGPLRQEEIAVAVLAELVAWRHTRGELPAPPKEAIDPVCGMTVSAATPERVVHGGTTYIFCSPGCRARFEADPTRYLAARAP